MPRVNLSDLNNYGGGGKFKKVPYLSLRQDGDTAQVHFLLNSADDLNECIYITHNVKLKSAPKMKYGFRVNCLREYNDPVEDCPFCNAGMSTQVSCVLPVYNVDADEVEFWTRGKKEANRLFKKIAKYKNFSEHLFELTRNGAENDQATDYEYEHLGEEDLPEDVEVPEILGTAVLDKTYEDMEYWLEEKDFPPEDNEDDEDEEEEEPVRRRPTRKDKEEPVRRRPNRKPEPEDDEDDEPPFDEDEEEEPVRRRPTGGRKVKRRSAEDDF